MKFPKLSEVIDDGVVLYLGAGSSCDYGYKLWKDMAGDFEKFFNSDLPRQIGLPISTIEFWLGALPKKDAKKDAEKVTVDSIADQAFDPDDYLAFQIAASNSIVEYEAHDRAMQEDGWIEKFSTFVRSSLSECGTEQQKNDFLAKFHIVSLNYDRCFEHRTKWIGKENPLLQFKIFQPHGTVARLNTTSQEPINEFRFSSTVIPYGDRKAIKKLSKEWPQKVTNVDNVGTRTKYSNPIYQEAKQWFRDYPRSTIICIGLSPDGINQSNLFFPECKNVIFTLSESEIELLAVPRSPGTNWCFHSGGIYASPLLELLV